MIGNVSTSHFRPGTQRKGRASEALLELRPRYPLLGGWNYTFTVGWDAPLADSLKYSAEDDRYVLAVPFWTPLKDVVVGDEELRVVLPEGARDVRVSAPFPLDEIHHGVHKTYLDTSGRPTVTLRKRDVTEHHALPVFVSYSYSRAALWRKPLTVAAFVGGVLLLFVLLRRVDYSIERKKKRKVA